MNSEEILKLIKEDMENLIEDRRYLHEHAEVGFELENTIAYVQKRLKEAGLKPERVGKAGIVATICGNPDGKVILLRADMDALPIMEETGVEFACQNGKMHACGHDMHTAMLLGAARFLASHKDRINGTVKLLFQPAEELLEGAKDVIEAGVLKNPKVDAAMMLHVIPAMPFKAGNVIVAPAGVSAPAADYFTIEVQGKGCHGAMPVLGIDPINIAAHIIISLQELHARELAMGESSVLTIGKISSVETAVNVIPDKVILGGSMRAYDEQVREKIKTRLKEIAEKTAEVFRGSAEVKWGSGCPTLLNDEKLSFFLSDLQFKVSDDIMKKSAGETTKASGSEDFAYISHKVPSIMLAVAAGQPEDGYKYPLHHPKVMFDEAALPYGSTAYAYMAVKWLEAEKHMIGNKSE